MSLITKGIFHIDSKKNKQTIEQIGQKFGTTQRMSSVGHIFLGLIIFLFLLECNSIFSNKLRERQRNNMTLENLQKCFI